MIDRNIFYFGAYAPGELAFLDRCATAISRKRESLTFYDIGANSGQHSLFMSRKCSAVHAFEPSRKMVDRLERNVALNQLQNIVVHQVALSDVDGIAELGSGFSGNSGSRSLNWTLPGQATEQVVVKDAGRYLNECNLPRIDVLKLDVEGYESRVLKGLSQRLVSDRPVVLMELIGDQTKGGFASAEELRAALYPNHELRSLKEMRRRHILTDFDWACETAVAIPAEYMSDFQ